MDPRFFLLIPVLACPAFLLLQWWRRRAAFREFAHARGLRFRGTIPSDKYPPYACFRIVAQAVLLYHVAEGRVSGFEVAVFDFPKRRGTDTGVIVSGVPVGYAPPPNPDGNLTVDAQDGHLLGHRAQVPVEDLPELLSSVVSLARRGSE